MKSLILSLIFTFSAAANADYFFCRLTVNNHSAEQEADYKVYKAEVSLGEYTCGGIIPSGSRYVDVILTSSRLGSLSISQLPTASLHASVPTAEGTYEAVTCECGLQ